MDCSSYVRQSEPMGRSSYIGQLEPMDRSSCIGQLEPMGRSSYVGCFFECFLNVFFAEKNI